MKNNAVLRSCSEVNYEAKCTDISYLWAHFDQLYTLWAKFYRGYKDNRYAILKLLCKLPQIQYFIGLLSNWD